MDISNDGVLITNRFFLCIDLLKDSGRMSSIADFAETHGINRSRLTLMRNNPEHVLLKPEVIKWLCEDYGVYVEYIIFGKGKILKQ